MKTVNRRRVLLAALMSLPVTVVLAKQPSWRRDHRTADDYGGRRDAHGGARDEGRGRQDHGRRDNQRGIDGGDAQPERRGGEAGPRWGRPAGAEQPRGHAYGLQREGGGASPPGPGARPLGNEPVLRPESARVGQ